jgi:hypothetical protein
MSSGMARELRESIGYVRDAGWHSFAVVLERASVELDFQSRRIAELELRLVRLSAQSPLCVRIWRSHFWLHRHQP